MSKDIIVIDYTTPLSLEEVCQICGLSVADVDELISYEIIHPQNTIKDELVFDLVQLQRVKTALRLKRDLEINLSGIALVLDLLEELQELRKQAQLFERHFR